MTTDKIDNSQLYGRESRWNCGGAYVRDRRFRKLRAAESAHCAAQRHRYRAQYSRSSNTISSRAYKLRHIRRRHRRSTHGALHHSRAGESGSRAGRRVVSSRLRDVVVDCTTQFACRAPTSRRRERLAVFEPDRLQVLARVQLGGSFDDYYVGLPFFGLAATVCAWLWLKSRYIPRWLSLFGVIGSAWCVFCAFVYLIFPGFGKPVDPYWFDSPMAIFELILSFWLLFKGLKQTESSNQPANIR